MPQCAGDGQLAERCWRSASRITSETGTPLCFFFSSCFPLLQLGVESHGLDRRRRRPESRAPALAPASKDLIDVKAGFRFVCQPFDHLVGDGSA